MSRESNQSPQQVRTQVVLSGCPFLGFSFTFCFLFETGCLRVSIAVTNTINKISLGRESFLPTYSLQSITQGSQDRNSWTEQEAGGKS